MKTIRPRTTCPRSGFTLVEIMIVVGILGIILMIALPTWIRQRQESQRRACQENLSKIDGAKEQWALDGNQPAGETPNWTDLCALDGTSYIKADSEIGPTCPASGDYEIGAVGELPTCSLAALGHRLD